MGQKDKIGPKGQQDQAGPKVCTILTARPITEILVQITILGENGKFGNSRKKEK